MYKAQVAEKAQKLFQRVTEATHKIQFAGTQTRLALVKSPRNEWMSEREGRDREREREMERGRKMRG